MTSKTNTKALLAQIEELKSMVKHRDAALILSTRFITNLDKKRRGKVQDHEQAFLSFVLFDQERVREIDSDIDAGELKRLVTKNLQYSEVDNKDVQARLDALHPERHNRPTLDPVFSQSVCDSEMALRTTNALRGNRINTFGELVCYNKEELLKLANMQLKGIKEIECELALRGLFFDMSDKDILNYQPK